MLASRQCVGMRAPQQQQQRSGRVALAARPLSARTVVALPGSGLRRQQPLTVLASTMAPTPNQSGSSEERNQGLGGFSPMMGVPNTTMAGGGGFGSQGSLGATMERSRLNFVMPTPVVQGPKLDDGGDGGDIGKINRNGGGGDGGGGDDDDWFGEEDGDGDGEGGEGRQGTGFFRTAIPEQYDKFSIGAVFSEWMKTVQDLPAILRQAVQMGLFSSAQLVRFFSIDVRPSVTRSISRHLPPSAARDFVGRLMADPGFVQKMVLEAAFASCASLWYEFRARGDRFKDELDLVFINTIGMAAATGATVWLLAPSRSYGSLQKLPWQQMLEGLPNCVFDVSGPLRAYTKQARAAGFLAKAAELSAVGALTGTATSLLASAAVAVRQRANPEWQPSVAAPSVGRSSGGLAAFFALNANVRYQLVGGLDRFLFDRTTFLWTYVALSGAARLASNQVGEISRAWWQGLPAPSSLATPAFLAAPAMPITRRIKKKVQKRVPRSSLLQQQQQQQGATMAATAAAAAAVVLPEAAAESAAAALATSALVLEPAQVEVALPQQQQQHLEQPAQAPVQAEQPAAAVLAATQQQQPAAQQQQQLRVLAAEQARQQESDEGTESAAPAYGRAQQQQQQSSEEEEESSEQEQPQLQQRRGGVAYAARH